LRRAALRGLASYDDPKTPDMVLQTYATMTSAEKRDALATLAARADYGKALLDAVALKKVAALDIPAELVRQLRNLHDKELDARIGEVWGLVRDTPADKAKQMASYRKMLTASYQAPADRSLGRALFAKTCAQCHALFGVGGKVGPDITGGNRASLDYLLENILDPSAVIPKEYAATLIELKNGRLITGIVREQTASSVTVTTANETLAVPRGDIETLKPTPLSMMPDDQLKPMKDEEVRALIAYLQSPAQVPLLATADNAKDFFSGNDLAGWDGNASLWKVENGEIVGHSPGSKRNEFLTSHMTADDFRLTFKVKLVPESGRAGLQFRSEVLSGGEVSGPEVGIGHGAWGKLYDEKGARMGANKSEEASVKPGDWNEYEIIVTGGHIRTFINGKPCASVDDPSRPHRGILALHIHSGGPLEVRFKELRLEVNPNQGP
jgi:putative heme-binding domain-containing protein